MLKPFEMIIRQGELLIVKFNNLPFKLTKKNIKTFLDLENISIFTSVEMALLKALKSSNIYWRKVELCHRINMNEIIMYFIVYYRVYRLMKSEN